MLSLAKEQIKKAVLAKEDRLAREDDLYKWSSKEPWRATPDLRSLQAWSKDQTAQSRDFFKHSSPQIKIENGRIEFPSSVQSQHPENNVVRGQYFKSFRAKSAVVIVGHWNASYVTYNRLAKIYQVSGLSALRLSLPYHDERKPANMPIASGILSSDLNQTILGIRQGVVDVRVMIDWLKSQGYERIGIIGASLGSSVALLAAAHDERINAMVGYLSAADTADLIWRSSATQHLRESFEPEISLDDLRQAWSCITPANYLSNLQRPGFSIHVGWAKFDTVCPPDLTQSMLSRLRDYKIEVSEATYRCGHNTLATTPFIQLSGYRGLAFLREKL